ncbi:MAG: TRAP transporter small permease [Burkholderiaceae bacterium]|nr:TRAP transporter small permease [Burkholderiaceae bacterium]MCD8517023.1 TRAP transporter small permease [Burkholderiaceae bacterium]MCD8536930.1 TRAP transporter small permease [Burkholderiaceae bacterium]
MNQHLASRQAVRGWHVSVVRAVSLLLCVLLFVMVVLTFVDVLGRRMFNTPVYGANDMTEHLMALIVFSGLPLLTARRGHLSIDLLDGFLLQPAWRAWHKAVDGLIAAILVLIAWQFGVLAQEAVQINEISPALLIPRAWIYTYMSGCSLLAAVLAVLVPSPVPTQPQGVTS